MLQETKENEKEKVGKPSLKERINKAVRALPLIEQTRQRIDIAILEHKQRMRKINEEG